jgi:hypothetical protein
LYVAGVVIYLRTTKNRNGTGIYAFWSLIGLLYLAYWASIIGAPPPDEGAIAVAGNATWLFVLWASWADRHRMALPQ